MQPRTRNLKYLLPLMTRLGVLLFAFGQLAPISIWCMEADGRVVLESGRGGCLTDVPVEQSAASPSAGSDLSEQCANGRCRDVTIRQAATKSGDARFLIGTMLPLVRPNFEVVERLNPHQSRPALEIPPAPSAADRCHRLRRIQV